MRRVTGGVAKWKEDKGVAAGGGWGRGEQRGIGGHGETVPIVPVFGEKAGWKPAPQNIVWGGAMGIEDISHKRHRGEQKHVVSGWRCGGT